MFEIQIERDFAAAHYLRGYDGNCSSLHGHNWVVRVIAKSEELDELGIALDFKALKAALDALLDELDHKCLNDLPGFTVLNPTAEHIAKYLYDELVKTINNGVVSIDRVRIFENAKSCATYYQS